MEIKPERLCFPPEKFIIELPRHLESELVNRIVALMLSDSVLDAEFILDDILDAEEIG